MKGLRTAGLLGLLLAIVGPAISLVVTAFSADWFYPALLPSTWTFEGWRALWGGRLGVALAGSMGIGAGCALLATSVALPLGRWLARRGGQLERVGAAAAFLPVAIPPVALATGLHIVVLALGLGGTVTAVMLGHAVPAIGYLTLFFLGIFRGLDPELEPAARTLGASRLEAWRHVLLPLLRRPLAEGYLLGFLISWAQVPLTLTLGGGAVRTLATELLAYAEAGQDRLAAVAALVLLAPTLLAVGVARRMARSTGTAAG